MEEGVVGARLGGWMEEGQVERMRSQKESIKVLRGCMEIGVMVKERKKRVPGRRVVPRIGSVVERETRVSSEADEARGDAA